MTGSISDSVIRFDSDSKSRGSERYVDDLYFEHMQYARTVRSTRAKAIIRSVSIPDLPEECTVIDASDVPGHNCVKMIKEDFPVFADKVVQYIGDPIMLVVGENREELDRIVKGIDIEYEDLPGVYSIEEARRNGDSAFTEYRFTKGDPAKAFSEAVDVIECEYETGYQEHIYLEPQGMIGVYQDERITVYGSLQCPYYVKPALVHAFNWSEDRFRVIQTATGGGFGGKEEFPSVVAVHAALGAYKTGKPVKVVYDRVEDIEASTKRHPSIIKYRTGIDSSGRVSCMEIDVSLDGGAYEGLSSVVLQRSIFAATGVYEIPNVDVHGAVYRTNTVPNGAFRGFGAPQAMYAIEMHMKHVADRLGSDPLAFKKMHMYRKGSVTATGGTIHHKVLLPEMIEKVMAGSDYVHKAGLNGTISDGRRYGIGFSLFLHGCGFTGSGERDKIKGKVSLKGGSNGRVEILVSSVEMGQGPSTTLRKVAAEALDIPIDRIDYQNPDTDRVPDSGPTVASRTAMVVGYMVLEAALKLKESWDGTQEKKVEVQYRHPDFVSWDQEALSGDAYPTYSWGVNVAEVHVDVLTGEITIDHVYGIYDLGKVLDEAIVRGQMEGGIAQGAGWSTIEVMEQKEGRLKNCSMTDYIIPTALDTPPMSVEFIDNPYEYGPYGAKGGGEIPLVGTPPAVAAAVENALSRPVYRIPIRPETILEEKGI